MCGTAAATLVCNCSPALLCMGNVLQFRIRSPDRCFKASELLHSMVLARFRSRERNDVSPMETPSPLMLWHLLKACFGGFSLVAAAGFFAPQRAMGSRQLLRRVAGASSTGLGAVSSSFTLSTSMSSTFSTLGHLRTTAPRARRLRAAARIASVSSSGRLWWLIACEARNQFTAS